MTTATLESLAAKVPVSLPGEDGYIEATSIWSQPPGPGPVAVAHCRGAADVQEAVRAARARGMPLSVRAGGHDWAGRALCPGLVIDLSPMRSVAVETGSGVVRMGGGALAGDVFRVADPIGRAAVTGTVGAVGMGGLTLGGGYGPLIGRFGLALDNLLSAEVVLADGSLAVADEHSNPELFWALRGGGGNFGVVTQMRHRLHSLPSVHSGVIIYPFEHAERVLVECAAFLARAPDELTAQVLLASDEGGRPVVLVVPTWSGAPEQSEPRVTPLTRLGTPTAVRLETRPPGAANTLFDAFSVKGMRVVMESRLLPRFTGESIGALVAAFGRRPSAGCSVVTHEFRGAAARVPAEATAFGTRREHVNVQIVAMSSAERSTTAHREWAKEVSRALAQFALPGGYASLLTNEQEDRVRASFGPNADRVARAKRRFDPDDVFRRALPLPSGTGAA